MGRKPLRPSESRTPFADPLPVEAEVGGMCFPLRWDFRVGILLSELFADESVDPLGKVKIAVKLLSPPLWNGVERGEVSLDDAFEAVLQFFSCGSAPGEVKRKGRGEPILDFAFDGERIGAAFLEAYGMDLWEVRLHWWKFTALLRSLPEGCALMRVLRLRTADLGGVTDEEKRRKLRRAKAMVRIRKPRVPQRKEGLDAD